MHTLYMFNDRVYTDDEVIIFALPVWKKWEREK